MKQLHHTPLYVPAYSMGEAPGHGKAFFHHLRRAFVCLLALAVLLACPGVVYAEEPDLDPVEWIDIQDVLEEQSEDPDPELDPGDQEDPPDPDYGGTADQDPAADPWIDPGYASDAEYGVQPYSSSTPWYWSSTDISKVTNVMDRLNGGSSSAGSLLRFNSLLESIKTNTANAGIDYTSKLDTLIANTGANGTIAGRLEFIYNRLGSVITEIQSTNSKLDTVNTNLNIANSYLYSIISSLSSLSSLLTSGSVRTLSNTFSYLSDDNIVFSSLLPSNTSVSPGTTGGAYSYFYTLRDGSVFYLPGTSTSSGNVIWTSTNSSTYTFFQYGRTSQPTFLTPGSYSLFFLVVADDLSSLSGDVNLSLSFSSSSLNFPGKYFVVSRPSGRKSIVYYGTFDISSPFSFWYVTASFPALTVSNGYFYAFVYRNSDVAYTDKVMGDSVNPGQAEATQQLQQAVDQTEQFEQKMFQDVSTYTSQLNFGLGDWAEAAAGISYIGSVFMLIWDNSPVQPIILSLMLGLCMLLLGRGARVADSMSRSDSAEGMMSFKQGKGK